MSKISCKEKKSFLRFFLDPQPWLLEAAKYKQSHLTLLYICVCWACYRKHMPQWQRQRGRARQVNFFCGVATLCQRSKEPRFVSLVSPKSRNKSLNKLGLLH